MRRITAAALTLFAGTLAVAAQDWPSGPVKLVVPFAAGATPDIVARLVANQLHDTLHRTFIVENRPGASGNTGTNAVARAAPDGATIGVSIGGPLAINALLFPKLPYDPRKDLTLITLLVTQPSVLAVNATLSVESTRALIDLVRRNPGKYAFGSIGAGSLSHLAMEAIALKSGTQLIHVPYPSSPQAMTALIRNDVQMVCLPAIAVMPQLGSGALKVLAVSTAERSALLPNIPTLQEAGLDVEADAWNGLIAPAGISPAMAARIGQLVGEAIGADDVRAKLAAQLMAPIPGTPAEFRARIDADLTRWAPVIAAAKIKVND
ncbi:MAG: tripartite tricarboxylate transporter substrate-binding protein [Xanthobacteraceae bacterium]